MRLPAAPRRGAGRRRRRSPHRASGTAPRPPRRRQVLHAGGGHGALRGLLDPEVTLGQRGDLGQVGDAQHLSLPPPARAGARPRRGPSGRPRPSRPRRTPGVPEAPVPATVMSASITRESSPPDAASRTGAAGTPGLGASIELDPLGTRSAPISSRGSSSTENEAPSMASEDSSASDRLRELGRRGARAFDSSAATAARSRLGLGERRVRAGERLLGVLEPVALGAAAVGMLEHRGDRAAVLALDAVEGVQALLHLLQAARVRVERGEVGAAARPPGPPPRSAAPPGAPAASPVPDRPRATPSPARSACASIRAAPACSGESGAMASPAGAGGRPQPVDLAQPLSLGR